MNNHAVLREIAPAIFEDGVVARFSDLLTNANPVYAFLLRAMQSGTL